MDPVAETVFFIEYETVDKVQKSSGRKAWLPVPRSEEVVPYLGVC
jgi:hypothetical protein